MRVHNIEFAVDLNDILMELKSQLNQNRIDLLHDIKDGPKNVQVTCIYHANGHEHKPSAGIKKDTGVYHCFSCQETHDLPEFISNCFGKNDMGAFGWSWLLKNFLTIEVENRNVSFDFSRTVSNANNANIEKYVTEEELDSYRYYHPYWKKRGIVDESIIELFDLGYDLDNKMITFPNKNKNGKCLFVAKRSISTKFFHYPNGVTKEVYGIYELYQLEKFPKEVYITESMIDTLRLWQVGKYSCALNGLGNSIQFKQLTEMPNRVFILATDSDEAGIKARNRIRENVKGKLFLDVVWPEGRKDAGECLDEELINLTIDFI